MPLPEQPGEPRISVHWFFLPVGLCLVAAGLVCLREYFIKHNTQSILYTGWVCIFLGLFEWLTFALCQRRIRAGRPPKAMFTLPLRKTILVCAMFGYLILFAMVDIKLSVVFSRLGMGQMLLFTPLLWLITVPFVWNAIVRYFINHPPKQ